MLALRYLKTIVRQHTKLYFKNKIAMHIYSTREYPYITIGLCIPYPITKKYYDRNRLVLQIKKQNSTIPVKWKQFTDKRKYTSVLQRCILRFSSIIILNGGHSIWLCDSYKACEQDSSLLAHLTRAWGFICVVRKFAGYFCNRVICLTAFGFPTDKHT